MVIIRKEGQVPGPDAGRRYRSACSTVKWHSRVGADAYDMMRRWRFRDDFEPQEAPVRDGASGRGQEARRGTGFCGWFPGGTGTWSEPGPGGPDPRRTDDP
jgi:hypothetical protein